MDAPQLSAVIAVRSRVLSGPPLCIDDQRGPEGCRDMSARAASHRRGELR